MELQSEKTVLTGLKVCFKTVVCAFLITIILMGVLALCICFTPLPETAVTPSVYVLNYVSVFLAGLISAAKAKRKGFVVGGISGALYMLFVYLLGCFLFGGIAFTKEIALNIFYCLVTGMAGGIVGINISHG